MRKVVEGGGDQGIEFGCDTLLSVCSSNNMVTGWIGTTDKQPLMSFG